MSADSITIIAICIEHSFDENLRSLRLSKSIGRREVARRLKILAPYLSNTESNNRDAPRGDLIIQIGEVLQAGAVRLYHLAGRSRGDIALDVAEMVQGGPETVALPPTVHEN